MYVWKITDEIRDDLYRIEERKHSLDRRGVLPRRWAGRLRRELESASVAASTSMEGVPVTVDEVRRILAGDRPKEVSEEDARLVEGYRDAMSFVLRRADDESFAWQTELILGIHDRVMAGSHSAGAGRFRTRQVHVADTEAVRRVYEPPFPDQVPGLVARLAAFAEDAAFHLDPPVLAALIHIRLAGIHPFNDGNGRTARVLASLAMYRGGYTRPEFTSLEEWWGTHHDSYVPAFACLGESWAPDADVSLFVATHVQAQRVQVDALSLRQLAEREIWTILEDLATEDLSGPPRLADALYDAFFGREVTNRYYRGLTDVSVATATNDLARLEASGLVASVGAGRSRAYMGTHALLAAVARSGAVAEALSDPETPLSRQRAAVVASIARRLRGPDSD